MNNHITHPHPPEYDKDGNLICCSLEEKIDGKTPPPIAPRKEEHHADDGHDHSHGHSHDGEMGWKDYLPALISLVLLLSGLAMEHLLEAPFFAGWIKIVWYTAAYLPVGLPVMKEAWEALRKGEVFTEFFLMSIATIGAFAISEYPEGVAVMLFYAVGELFQTAAVRRAKNNIKALLDVRPNTASVLKNGNYQTVEPETVQIGETIQVKVGEKIPLDGTLLSEKAALNTAALTGESKPQNALQGEKILAGSINLDGVIELKVEKLFNDSSIARILELVQNATARKSKTELLIRRLAKIYTPIVVYLAIAICVLPYFFVADYVFTDWLYRALIFLVISCPCALVISIPLGYFGGLGAASKNGLLFKGATYLDQLTKVNTLVMDKTGTVTKGVFKIKDIVVKGKYSEDEFMRLLMALEAKSTHPIAKAIMEYAEEPQQLAATNIQEIAGKGLKGEVMGKTLVVGNKKLMEQFNITAPAATDSIVESIVMVGIDGQFAGYVTIADELKADAKDSIQQLRQAGIKNLMMLSGDKDSITQKVAAALGIENAKGGLLPEDKLNEVERIQQDKTKVVAFVGDGINDAPVLAASDVGIAMGGLGSDVAIETADVIIQTDQPSKIATGIRIGKSTQRIIWQNIGLAFGVKAIVLILGALGMATMWAAVFADVGVALLAVLNAVRLQRKEW
jgi:Cd2+/Zn2+-exporting ATPase